MTNAHGNTGSSSLDVTIDAQLPGLRIDTVAGDDVINVIEHAQNLVISGTSTDLAAGSTVPVTINGKSYSASVQADGTWQAAVPAADVSRWADGSLTISASAQDTSGNPVNIGTVVDVDLAPVAISINSVTDDNVLNSAEKGGIWYCPAPPRTLKRARPLPLSLRVKPGPRRSMPTVTGPAPYRLPI